jgi:hypothetical protein
LITDHCSSLTVHCWRLIESNWIRSSRKAWFVKFTFWPDRWPSIDEVFCLGKSARVQELGQLNNSKLDSLIIQYLSSETNLR